MNSSYIDDNDSALSVDVEGVSDSASHSKLAMLSLVPLVVGILAPVESRLAFFSGAAVLMALLALFFARRETLTGLSRYVAFAVIFVGTIATVWGITNLQIQRAKLFTQATKVAQDYMGVLAEGNMLRAIQLVGLDPVVQDVDGNQDAVTPSQKAVKNYVEDYALNQIVKRGKQAKWTSQGVINYHQTLGEHQFIVRFVDKSRDNPSPFDVIVLYSPPSKYAPEKIDRWMIERVEQVN